MKKFLIMALMVLGLGFASCSNHSTVTGEVADTDSVETVVDSVEVMVDTIPVETVVDTVVVNL